MNSDKVMHHDSYPEFVVTHNDIAFKDGDPLLQTQNLKYLVYFPLRHWKGSELSLIYDLLIY